MRRAPGKSRKRRKKAFFLGYPQICLNPHLLNPHLRHCPNIVYPTPFVTLTCAAVGAARVPSTEMAIVSTRCYNPPVHWTPGECPSIHLQYRVENTSTCYRAPKWPKFPRKIPKQCPRPKILDSQNIPPKIPRKYRKKYPEKTQKCVFWVFFWYFGGVFLGFQNFGPGGIFSVFFVEIPGRATLGLSGRS